MGLMALSTIISSLISFTIIEIVTVLILYLGFGVNLAIAILIGLDIIYKIWLYIMVDDIYNKK